MPARRAAPLVLLIAALTLASANNAWAQRGGAGGGGGGANSGRATGVIGPSGGGIQSFRSLEIDSGMPSPRGATTPYKAAGTGDNGQQTARRRSQSAALPEDTGPSVTGEVLVEVANSVSAQAVQTLLSRYRLIGIDSATLQLSGTTFYRLRISDGRPPGRVARALEGESIVTSAQAIHLFATQECETDGAAVAEGDAAQYALAKLQLPEAHKIANGQAVRVAVIDSLIDASHLDLAGAVTQSFDAIGTPAAPHKHGTGIASVIAAHGRLTGAAPAAQILAIRAFDPAGTGAEGSTFNILKGLDWAAANSARVINMSFAGPPDPAIHRALDAAHKKGIVLVAAAGNAGPNSPPLYPAADPNVIAVTATDADDKLFDQSSRGRHIAVAAPGVQIMAAIPDGGYELASGTSYAAAEVSGIVALLLEQNGRLKPDKVRDILMATARDLGPKGRDSLFGAGLANAYDAIIAGDVLAKAPAPAARASTGTR